MDSNLSKKIANTNLILTIMIVLLHSDCFTYLSNGEKYYDVTKYISSFIQKFCSIAVPTFFVLSSYLFFINYDNSKYFVKLKSRIKSLVVPYLCWSTIFLIFFVIISNLPWFSMFNGVFTPIEYSVSFFIKNILMSTYDGVLWFVRDLFIFVLLAPIIYFANIKFGIFNYFIIILVVALNIIFKTNYYSVFYWIPLYVLSSYVTINHKNRISEICI